MDWITIKAKLIGLGAFLLAIAAAVLRHKQVVAQRDKARQAAADAKAEVEERRDIDNADREIDSKYSDLEREAREDLENDEMPDVIRNRRTG